MTELEKELDELTKKLSTSDKQTKHDIETKTAVKNYKMVNICKTRWFKLEPHAKRVTVNVKPRQRARTKMDFFAK